MENNFKYIVYLTVNLVNNKIYIGFHKTKDPNVFDGYIGNGVNIFYPSTYMNPKWPFQLAVKKYGTNNFKRTIIGIYDTKEEALQKEAELVNKEFISRSDTYNLIEGGIVHPINREFKKVYQYDTEGNLLKIWDDCSDAANFLETWTNSIYSAIKDKQRLHGFYWSFEPSINVSEFSSPNLPTKTYKYNQEGKCVAIYDSMYIAAKENNCKISKISKAITYHSLTDGFYYSNKLYDTYIAKEHLNLKHLPIYCYDCNTGEFVREYSDQKALKKDLEITKRISPNIISGIPIKGLILKLEKVDRVDPYTSATKRRAVIVYNKQGEVVQEFESVMQAVKTLNLDSSSVNKILRGTQKFTKGYTIKYKN